MNKTSLLVITLFIALIFSCKKEDLFTEPSAKLQFSEDTVTFDTVFTDIGSTTAWLKVYNPYDSPLEISSIKLGNGTSSFFRLNVDGEKSYEVRNKRIAKKDSLFIFVEVTVDPTNINNPFLVNDSIIFTTNGNVQYVYLNAWGQDVHFFENEIITSQTWSSDKPYLIYGNIILDENEVLTINPGTKVHFHRNASMVIFGTLMAQGELDNPIIFQGDRLEELYKEIPGQWGTIVFLPPSSDNIVEHTIIKNSIAGLQIGEPDTTSGVDINISNSRILNASYAGILAYDAKVRAYNVIIGESEFFAVALFKGGDYEFYHCTLANTRSGFSGSSTPLIYLTNYTIYEEFDLDVGEIVKRDYRADMKKAYFVNTLVYNGADNNLQIADDEIHNMNYKFENCAISLHPDSFDINDETLFKACVLDEPIRFIEKENENDDAIFDFYSEYELDTLSPAKDKANLDIVNQNLNLLEFDINGISRVTDGKPDIGAVERVE